MVTTEVLVEPARDIGESWPRLPLEEWEDTYATLHRWIQIVGKPAFARADAESLREYVEASGGRLDLIARYRDTEIRLSQFADLASA